MKKYDALFIFVNVRDEAFEQLIEKVNGEITRLNGNILGSEMLGKKPFARPMQKQEAGVYLRVRFELEPAQIETLRGRYALMEDVFRVQLLLVDDRRERLVVEQNARRAARAAAEEEAARAARAVSEEEAEEYEDIPAEEDA